MKSSHRGWIAKAVKMSLDGRWKEVIHGCSRGRISVLALWGSHCCALCESCWTLWLYIFFFLELLLAPSQASPVWISQHSAALLPAPTGFPPLGFYTLLQHRQRQIGHFTLLCTTAAAQLGVQVRQSEVAQCCQQSGVCPVAYRVAAGVGVGDRQRNSKVSEAS